MMFLVGFVCGALLGSLAAVPHWIAGSEQQAYMVILGFALAGAVLLPLMNRIIGR